MNFKREVQLGKDSAAVIAARFGAQGSLAIFTILIARRLGSAGFGEYAFMAAVIFIANIITTFGTDMLLIREIAAKRDFSQFIPSLFLQLSLSVVLIVLTWLLHPLPGQSQDGWLALKIYSFSLIPFAIFTVFSSVLRGMQRMKQYASLNFSISVFQLIAAFLFVNTSSKIVSLAWLLLAVQAAAAFLAAWLCRDQFTNFHFPERFSLQRLRTVLPLAVLGIFNIIFQSLGILLVTFLLGAAATGHFSAARRVVEFAKTAHLAIFTVLYPALAKSQRELMESRLIWFLLLGGALAAALGIFLLAAPLTEILYGPDYSESAELLRLYSWVMVPFTIGTFFSLVFISAKQEKPVLVALITSVLTLILLNFLWTPSLGIMGAGWALILAEIVNGLVLLAFYKSLYGVPHEFPEPV